MFRKSEFLTAARWQQRGRPHLPPFAHASRLCHLGMSARLTSAVEGIRGLDRDSEQAEENEDGALAARSSAHPAA